MQTMQTTTTPTTTWEANAQSEASATDSFAQEHWLHPLESRYTVHTGWFPSQLHSYLRRHETLSLWAMKDGSKDSASQRDTRKSTSLALLQNSAFPA